MHVGFLQISVFIPYAENLKQKRSVVRSILGKVNSNFNVSAAEVGDNELWQRSKLGFALVGNDARFVESKLDKLLNYIEENIGGQIVDVQKSVESFEGGR
ncbi:MAG: DUF503 domain-containing protein [Myxococcota bacterium]